jgi:predicted HTH transcriptional regulator
VIRKVVKSTEQSQKGQNETKKVLNRTNSGGNSTKKGPPTKQKGSVGRNRIRIRTAILNGEWTKYDDFQDRFGVGRSTISAVIKELKDQGLISKQGHNIEVKTGRKAG